MQGMAGGDSDRPDPAGDDQQRRDHDRDPDSDRPDDSPVRPGVDHRLGLLADSACGGGGGPVRIEPVGRLAFAHATRRGLAPAAPAAPAPRLAFGRRGRGTRAPARRALSKMLPRSCPRSASASAAGSTSSTPASETERSINVTKPKSLSIGTFESTRTPNPAIAVIPEVRTATPVER